MGLLSSNMAAEVALRSAPMYWALDLALPGGTLRYSMGYVASSGEGAYSGKIVAVDRITRSAKSLRYGLEMSDFTVTLDDTDRSIMRIVNGASGNGVRGSLATLRLASLRLDAADWFTAYSGVVAAVDFPAPFRARFRLTWYDLPLRRSNPARVIQRAWAPYAADSGVIGQPFPLVYGKHNSQGIGDKGAVPTLLIDKTIRRYLVSIGYCKTVDRAYVGGDQVYSGFTAGSGLLDGVFCTYVDFDADSDPGTAAVTVDCQGFEDAGDGSGALIVNPVSQIRHWLSNFVFANWYYYDGSGAAGAWYSTSSYVDTTVTHGATFMDTETLYGSFYVGGSRGQRDAIDVLNEWCGSWLLSAFWTNAGRIAFDVDSYNTSAVLSAAPHWRWDTQEADAQGSLRIAREADQIADSVNIAYAQRAADKTYTGALVVMDPSLSEGAQADLNCPASAAYIA